MSWLSYEFGKVVDLVVKGHEGQNYGNAPYTYHLQNVENLVRFLFQFENKEDTAKLVELAWLHDILEDKPKFYHEYVKHLLPLELQEAVEAISKRKGETREEYILRCKKNPYARKVKIADTMSNLEHSIKDGNIKRIRKYTKQLESLYEETTI